MKFINFTRSRCLYNRYILSFTIFAFLLIICARNYVRVEYDEIIKYVLVTDTDTVLMGRKHRMEMDCFQYHKFNNRTLLPNILEHRKQPNENNKNIFFHETSCIRDGVIKLNARQACAIESAAKMNPDWDVFVLFSARVGFNNKSRLPLFDQLSSYPNIHLRHVNINSYTKGTPIAKWMANGILNNSTYFNTHLSDTLRLVSLWKFGGTYLDTDVIVKKSFNPLKSNYAGLESDKYINGAVLNFDSFNGHKIVGMCLRELMDTFSSHIWGGNGPQLITRVLVRVCGTNISTEMNPSNCNGFQVLPLNEFYAIPYEAYEVFFNEIDADEVLLETANSTVVHFWNKLTANEEVKVGSKVAYGVLANEYCPNIYSNCGEYF